MGANSHERVVGLWRPGAVRYVRSGKRIRQWDGRMVDEMVRKEGRRTRITPEEAWQQVYDEEGYESGHSYSGGFGSKHGMVVIAANDKLDRYIGEVGTLVSHYVHDGIEGFGDPLKMPRGKVPCNRCWGGGKVRKDPDAFTGDRITCPDCNGSGKRARTAEEKAEIRKKISARKKIVALLGETTLRRAAQVYDDKWGPAAAIVGKDKVWFGGYCPS